MDRKLATKVQKITPKLPEMSQNIAKALVIEADDENSLEKKGTIYTLFDVSGRKGLDVLLVTKVVNDVLHDAYFQSESASPIQSIEKAILKLRDNINQLSATESGEQALVTFNINTAILWGNTLYVVQYGKTHAYLMREGDVKPISAASEGNFSVSSGVVKDNDVVILATEEFERKFLPDKLLNLGELQTDTLENLEAALMLKFDITKTFSTAEVVDFGSKLPETEAKKEKTPDINKPRKKRIEAGNNKLIPIIGLIVLLAGLGIAGAVYSGKQKLQTNTQQITQTEKVEEPENTQTEIPLQEIDEDSDRINRISRVDPSVFYDLKITEESAKTNQIAIVGDTLVVSNALDNTFYISNVETPKFTKTSFQPNNLKNIISYGENLGITDDDGFKSIDLATDEVVETYEAIDLTIVSSYLDFLYTIDNDTIIRYSKDGEVLTGTTWTQNDALINAKSLAVDVSIFVISSEDKLLRFTTGEQDDFTLEGLDKGLNNATEVLTDTTLEYMYVADAGNNRLLVFSEDGVLQKQYIPTEQNLWNDMKDIAINEDETMAYVLAGDKIYEVPLDFVEKAEVIEETTT